MPGPPENFASLLRARRGYLATGTSDGAPHVTPVCFTWAGDVIWAATDPKPPSPRHAQRGPEPQSLSSVSFLVDRWDEDWSRLAWLQAKGSARQLPREAAESQRAMEALQGKYSQYADTPVSGRVLRIDVDHWVTWEA